MRVHRFYTTTKLEKNITVTDVGFIHQWKNVFRYTAGNSIVLFGSGIECEYKITSIDKKSVELELICQTPSLERNKEITLAISLIKKDNLELVLQKCTELGVTDFILLQTDRSEKKGFNRERLEKILVEATEQSGWGSVPTLSDIKKLNELCANDGTNIIVLDDSGIQIKTANINEAKSIICIGPEGGFTDGELQEARTSGAQILSFGHNTLRAETAAISIASISSL